MESGRSFVCSFVRAKSLPPHQQHCRVIIVHAPSRIDIAVRFIRVTAAARLSLA
jgi:hypothetical protein